MSADAQPPAASVESAPAPAPAEAAAPEPSQAIAPATPDAAPTADSRPAEGARAPFPADDAGLSLEEARPFLRQIHDQDVPGVLSLVTVATVDLPGPGGANHEYQILGIDPTNGDYAFCTPIRFQNGPIHEAGVNGLTNESLLAIVIDRLRGFQYPRNPTPEDGRGHFLINEAGPYACPQNQMALNHLVEAIHWLKRRTAARAARGVEGTSMV